MIVVWPVSYDCDDGSLVLESRYFDMFFLFTYADCRQIYSPKTMLQRTNGRRARATAVVSYSSCSTTGIRQRSRGTTDRHGGSRQIYSENHAKADKCAKCSYFRCRHVTALVLGTAYKALLQTSTAYFMPQSEGHFVSVFGSVFLQ